MSTPISNPSSGYLNSLLSELQKNSTPGTTSKSGAIATPISFSAAQGDSSQLSPFAQILSTLQKLEQSNPAQYAQLTQQIGTNLQAAAQADTASGNTAGATQLTQLATDFNSASQSGQLPNIQDLAQALQGGGGGRYRHHASSVGADSSSASAFQIISDTLAKAGIGIKA